MRNFTIIVLILISTTAFGQDGPTLKKIDFNGYTQLRGSSNFDDNTTFMVRRLKFWLRSTPAFSDRWSYKVQVLFTSWMQERFFLQDVRVSYRTRLFSFDIGQFIPKYSLQRFQPDFVIPSIERARAIDALIPDGTLGVRDIGLQAGIKTKDKLFSTSVGLFNGYGIKEYRFNNQGYMITHKTGLNIPSGNGTFQLGYSLQYRYAENLQLKHILPDTARFTGDDFRYNFFAMYKSGVFALQAEYLNADLEGMHANGWYALSWINIKKSQIVLSYEVYKDLIPETNDSPYYRIGYNYLINNHKLKLFFDNYFQISRNGIEKYLGSIQLQVFIK